MEVLATPKGFEPSISGVTSQRIRPDYATEPLVGLVSPLSSLYWSVPASGLLFQQFSSLPPPNESRGTSRYNCPGHVLDCDRWRVTMPCLISKIVPSRRLIVNPLGWVGRVAFSLPVPLLTQSAAPHRFPSGISASSTTRDLGRFQGTP